MKMNKWTIGLAAVGVVSLSSVAQAQEAAGDTAVAVVPAASSVEINGYVSTSYRMDGGEDIRVNTGYSNETQRDRFSLDVLDLQFGIDKSSGSWGAGAFAELWIGHQAANLATDTDGDASEELAVKQAYIDMNTPLDGLELKLGVFDTILGYEYHNFTDNQLHSRSWGFTIEPTTHTGLLASYKVSESIGVSLGLANTSDAQINQGATDADNKTVLAAVSLKLPEGWWPWADSTNPAGINLGMVSGKEGATDSDVHNFYAAADLPLPAGFGLGLVFDLQKHNGDAGDNGAGAKNLQREDNSVLGVYLTYDITEDLHAIARYEYADIPEYAADGAFLGGVIRSVNDPATTGTSSGVKGDKIQSITVGLSYDLWDNVTTRVEYRHDAGDGLISETQNTTDSIIASVIYKF